MQLVNTDGIGSLLSFKWSKLAASITIISVTLSQCQIVSFNVDNDVTECVTSFQTTHITKHGVFYTEYTVFWRRGRGLWPQVLASSAARAYSGGLWYGPSGVQGQSPSSGVRGAKAEWKLTERYSALGFTISPFGVFVTVSYFSSIIAYILVIHVYYTWAHEPAGGFYKKNIPRIIH